MIICDPVGRRASALLPASPSHSAADGDDDTLLDIPAPVTASTKGEKGTTDPSSSSTISSKARASASAGVGGSPGGDVGRTKDGVNAAAVPLSTTDTERVVWPAWDLRAFIVKSNDDLRQEVYSCFFLCNQEEQCTYHK